MAPHPALIIATIIYGFGVLSKMSDEFFGRTLDEHPFGDVRTHGETGMEAIADIFFHSFAWPIFLCAYVGRRIVDFLEFLFTTP